MTNAFAKTDLSKPIMTKRFELVPMGRLETARQHQIVENDPALRALLLQREKPKSLFTTFLKTKGTKAPKRVYHKIIDSSSRKAIGYHIIRNIKYNSATMAVVIYDRDWWGKGTVLEVRKAAMIAYKSATNVTQFTSEVHSRNFASILNYKKLGFENVGVRYSCVFDETRGQAADYFIFSLRGDQLEDSIAAWINNDT